MTQDEFFRPFPQSRPIFDALAGAIASIGGVESAAAIDAGRVRSLVEAWEGAA